MQNLYDVAYSYDTMDLQDINNKFCKEMLSKISKLTLFPLIGDLIFYKRFSNYAWLLLPQQGLFMSLMRPRAAHQIAHALEMFPINRVTKPDFGFKEDCNVSEWSDKRLISTLARELRVRAIEAHIEPSNELRLENGDLKHKPLFSNEIWETELANRIPFKSYYKYDDFIEWGHLTFKSSYRAWSKDRIAVEWNHKVKAINDVIETKPTG